jgi:Kef-type K+ transport system membrane component KefB
VESDYRIAAIWIGLALTASLTAIRLKQSVALIEILVGVTAGNIALVLTQNHVLGMNWTLEVRPWLLFLAGFGSMLLTFLAGAEIEPDVLRRHYKESLAIGFASFAIPFVAATLFARYLSEPLRLGQWDWEAALICGIALSTTSVAVVYAVMVETGLNETELGKVILAACFVTDLGTVVALGACFAHYDHTLIVFVAVLAIVLPFTPRVVGGFFVKHANQVSEPGIKLIFGLLFGLGALAAAANSEAVLPAYLVGIALAGVMARQRDAVRRMRTTVFALTTPFYFLLAGTKVLLAALSTWAGLTLVIVLLGVKVGAKVVGVWPLTRYYGMGRREGKYTTLLMSTGLTFGTISALFGLNNGKITEEQYSILVAVVIASAIVPTVIAQTFFEPRVRPAVGGLVVRPAHVDGKPELHGEPITDEPLERNGQSSSVQPTRETGGGP